MMTVVAVLVACDSGGSSGVRVPDGFHRDSGLVAQWRFDDGVGESAVDSSGFGNTGTIRNGEWGRGKNGGGLQMNGGNDSIVVVPLSDSLRSTADAITVMAWTYRTDEHNVAVVAHGYPALFFGFHGPQFKWAIRSDLSIWDRAVQKLGSARATRADCYADPRYHALLNEWIHIAATFDGETTRLYANGVEICSRPLAGSIRMPDAPFTISGYLGDGGAIVDEITGMLDDVRIYNRALSEHAIMVVYLEGLEPATHP